MTLTLDHLRRYAVARSLFKPTTLPRAIQRLGFVQADPIRAPVIWNGDIHACRWKKTSSSTTVSCRASITS